MLYCLKIQKKSAPWPPHIQAEILCSWSKFYAKLILSLIKLVKLFQLNPCRCPVQKLLSTHSKENILLYKTYMLLIWSFYDMLTSHLKSEISAIVYPCKTYQYFQFHRCVGSNQFWNLSIWRYSAHKVKDEPPVVPSSFLQYLERPTQLCANCCSEDG